MTLEEITEGMRARVGDDAGLSKSVKFDFGDDGVVRIDDTQSPTVVDNTPADTDTTIATSLDTFSQISTGAVSPQVAMMKGDIKISGDLGLVMQLNKVLG